MLRCHCLAAMAILGHLPAVASATSHQQPIISIPSPTSTSLSITPLRVLPPSNTASLMPEMASQALSVPGTVVYYDIAWLRDRRGNQVGPAVKFPTTAVTAQAIRRMANYQVSAGRNRCAHTMREALGWGLGDAHQWLSLPSVGFMRRSSSEPAKPGDIVVWPFTFGSRHSQHIGIAVGTDTGVSLLSNLSGKICVSRLADGYAAFYKTI